MAKGGRHIFYYLYGQVKKVIMLGRSGVTHAAIHNIAFYLALDVRFPVLLLFGGLLCGLC